MPPFFIIWINNPIRINTMLLDEMFEPLPPQQYVIVRRNGELKFETRPIEQTEYKSEKQMFPIKKDRNHND